MLSKIIKRTFLVVMLLLVAAAVFVLVKISLNKKQREDVCFGGLTVQLESGVLPEEIFNKDFQSLQLLVENSIASRSKMLIVANKLRENRDLPLTSRDLLTLKEGSEYYLEIRENLLTIATAYECGLDVEESTLLEYNINQQTRLKGVMLSLGAALTLYDNYFLGIVLFQDDDRLRKLVNDPDMGFGLVANKLEQVTLNANSIESRHRIRRAISFFEDSQKDLAINTSDEDYDYLKTLIESSPSYNYIKKIRIKEIASNKLVGYERIRRDMVSETKEDGFDFISGLFGNTMGLFEFRKGKLHGDEQAKQHIMANLKPLDILVEKTPFRLTDKLIPGHFGHVAIWTGTKAELIDLNVWDNPYINKYAEEISSSEEDDSKSEHQIIEALRSGVQLSTLDHFLNVDDFAILRPVFKGENKESDTKEAVIMAFRQVGKKYDFNFDVNTTDKIVCSELAYVSFPTIDWPTEKTLGRHNISPDNVAKLAWNKVPLELVLFYHDGELVDKSEQLEKMKSLMIE